MPNQADDTSKGAAGETEVFGHNTDVSYRGHTFHVQTENCVEKTQPTIVTLVYQQGSLLRKVSNSCEDLFRRKTMDVEELKRRVRQQHVQVLTGLKKGELSLSQVSP